MLLRTIAAILISSLAGVLLPAGGFATGETPQKQSWIVPRYGGGLPSYWAARKIVSITLRCNSAGEVTSAELYDNNYDASVTDSLITLVWRWTMPPGMTRSHRGRPFTEVAHFVFDRSASTLPDRRIRGIPPFVARALNEPPLSGWLKQWTLHEPGLELTDFATEGYTEMQRVEGKGSLRSPELIQKSLRGMLLTSPDGRYVLDPFEGFEITSDGRLARDVDVGYATYDAKTGDRMYYWVQPSYRIDLARWVGRTVFVLLGEVRIDHPKSTFDNWVEAWVPAVWVGDVGSQRIALYVGVPALAIYRFQLERELTNRGLRK
jgi:hypothetical protein